MGDTEVDKDGNFDNGNEDKWKAERFFNDSDDEEDGNDRNDINNLEVAIHEFDHVFGCRAFADKKGTIVIFFHDFAQSVRLGISFVGSLGVVGTNEH